MNQVAKALLECKAAGICARDALATEWLRKRMKRVDELAQAVNEVYRVKNDLPQCPPVCDKMPVIGQVDE
jgi:hypothetical protein